MKPENDSCGGDTFELTFESKEKGAGEKDGNGALLESPYSRSLSLASLGVLAGTQVVLHKCWLSRAHL